MNNQLYGATPTADVLAGKAAVPTEFIPVMDTLKRHTEAAMAKLPHSRSRGSSMRGGTNFLPFGSTSIDASLHKGTSSEGLTPLGSSSS